MTETPGKNPAEQRMFDGLDNVARRVRPGKWFDALFRPFWKSQRGDAGDWQTSARHAIEDQQVLRARGVLYGIVAVFVILLLWTALASVDEVTRGEGKVIPSRQLQVIQSVDGGVVEEIFIEEGQKVTKDQVLIRIDPTRFVANLREGSAKVFALRAKIDRLTALVNDTDYAPQAPHAAENKESEGRESALILSQEQQFYFESRKQLDERLVIARQQLVQRRQELSEVDAALSAAERAYQMSQKELTITRPLLSSGSVSDMEVLRLEREVSNAEGERQQARARRGQLLSGIQEADSKIRDVELTTKNEWRAELAASMTELNSLDQNVTGLADRVKFSEIRSPVTGVVQRVLYNTIGGVVQPGHAVVEVVPSEDRLLVEAKVAPRDIAFLRPELPAVVKFTAYDFSIYGGMEATLSHISADSITDEKGNTYYLVRAETDKSRFKEGLPVIPGMTVQLDVLTGKKTILSYLLKPLLRAKQNALSER